MGEIADMMLDGTLCERCGIYLGRADGFPGHCFDCRKDEIADKKKEVGPPKIACPCCSKQVKAIGLYQHLQTVHGIEKSSSNQTYVTSYIALTEHFKDNDVRTK